MSDRLLTIYACTGPLCGGSLPADVVICVPWEKVKPHVCPEDAGNEPFQFTYIEGQVVSECLKGCGDTKQWEFVLQYNSDDLNPGFTLVGGDINGIACKGCLGEYTDQRAGNEVHVLTDEFGTQTLVSQHGCEYLLNAGLPVPVASVFGRVGAVVAVANDYTWAQIDKTVSDLADLTTKSHTSLTDIGVNTHLQIDAHIADLANPHAVTQTQVGLSAVTNDAQLKRAAGDFSTFAVKALPVIADVVLIEDSAAAGAKKSATLGTLPFVQWNPALFATSAVLDTTTSAAFVILTGMSITPPAGTYSVYFAGNEFNSSAATTSEYTIQVAGVPVANSTRQAQAAAADPHAINTLTVVTVTGVQAITAAFRRILGAGTVNILGKSLHLLKLA